MLKHRGECRAAGGTLPPKSEGGWSELYASGGYNADATLLVSFVNHNDDILGVKIRRKT